MAAVAGAATVGLEERPAPGGAFREAVIGRPQSLNPLLHPHDPLTRDVARLIHAGLVRVTDPGEIHRELASGWTTSADGLVYSFSIDPRARWHDGQAVTTSDVLATIELVRSPAYTGSRELADLWRQVRVELLDDRDVRLTLAQPLASFIEACAIPILPAAVAIVVSGGGDAAAESLMPQGAGPFRVEAIGAEGIVLRRNPYYLGPIPWLETVELRYFASMRDVTDALAAGVVDAAVGLSGDEARLVQQTRALTVREAPLLGHQTILFLNQQSPLLSDRAVRRAIALSVNRDTLLETAPGWGVPAFGPVPSSSWAYSREVEVPYDPGLARQLLDDAGWRGSPVRSLQGRQLHLTLLAPAADRPAAMAENLAEQLRAVGIQIDLRQVEEIDLYRERILPRTYELALLGVWLGGMDPDPYGFWHSSQRRTGFNFADYSDPLADDLLASARSEGDPSRRMASLTAFQRRWADEVPSVVLASPLMRYVHPADLRGVRLGTFLELSSRFQHVSEWHVRTERVWAFTRP